MSSSTHSCYVHRATTYNNVQVFLCDFSVTVKSKKNSINLVSPLSVNSFIKKLCSQIVKIVKRYFQTCVCQNDEFKKISQYIIALLLSQKT